MTSSPTIMTPGSPTFDVEDAAQYLKVSERTVRRLVASRAIRHRRVAGLVRFTREDLENYVESTLVAAET